MSCLQVVTGRRQWRELLSGRRSRGERIGLVPTMGALHAGHLSLVAAAREQTDFVALTIFVNPLQFGDARDLSAYPRDLTGDLALADEAGVGAVFKPAVPEMYPEGVPATTVRPGPLGEVLEGRARPSHFDGVATVVTKLLALAGPVACYFGEKDFQQLRVVQQLVADLDLPAEIVACPVVREPDGLALSSRNRRLSGAQRAAATVLWRALGSGLSAIGGGVHDVGRIEAEMQATLASEPLVRPDYAVAVDPLTLRRPATDRPPGAGRQPLRLLVAAEVGGVRLIDNAGAALE